MKEITEASDSVGLLLATAVHKLNLQLGFVMLLLDVKVKLRDFENGILVKAEGED